MSLSAGLQGQHLSPTCTYYTKSKTIITGVFLVIFKPPRFRLLKITTRIVQRTANLGQWKRTPFVAKAPDLKPFFLQSWPHKRF